MRMKTLSLLAFLALGVGGLWSQAAMDMPDSHDSPAATAAPTTLPATAAPVTEPSPGPTDPASPRPEPWQIGFDYFLGSLRLPYSSVISGLQVRLPASDDLPLALDLRLESQGTFLTLNPQAFDLTGSLVWEAMRDASGSDLGIGLGATIYGRFASLTDIRSSASSGFAPFLRLQGRAVLLSGPVDLDLGTTLDLAVFSDGLSLSLWPSLGLGISWFRASLEFRGEGLFRTGGEGRNSPDSELRMDTFLCLGVRLP